MVIFYNIQMFLFHILLFHLHRDDGGDDRDDAHAPLHVPHLRRYHDDVLHDLLLRKENKSESIRF